MAVAAQGLMTTTAAPMKLGSPFSRRSVSGSPAARGALRLFSPAHSR
jgi:hypothetical protein